jgi:hypothetical protein
LAKTASFKAKKRALEQERAKTTAAEQPTSVYVTF